VEAIVAVRDTDDPRLAHYLRPTDIRLRKSMEAAHGLFVARNNSFPGGAQPPDQDHNCGFWDQIAPRP
jgi:hypothetical protein